MNGTPLLDSPDRIIAKAWAAKGFRSGFHANPKSAFRAQRSPSRWGFVTAGGR